MPLESCQDLNIFLSADKLGKVSPPRVVGSLKLSISTEPLGEIDVSLVVSITVASVSQAPTHKDTGRVSGHR